MLDASEKKNGKVIYKRRDFDLSKEQVERRKLSNQVNNIKQRLTPSFVPLFLGFTTLLAIVFLLGTLSEIEIDKIQSDVTDLQFRQSEKFRFYDDVDRAFQNLNNEARIRAEGKKRNELMPPLEIKLNKARGELRDLFPQFDRQPFSQDEQWQALKTKLESFVKSTENIDTWDTNGFVQYRNITNQNLPELHKKIRNEQGAVNTEIEKRKAFASRRVRTIWIAGLGIGLVVVGVTLWEVQRRFRQSQHSDQAARRERRFSTQMLRGMVSAVAAIDSEGRIRSANAPFFEIFPNVDVGEELQSSEELEIKARLVAAANMTPVKTSAYRGRWKLDDLKTIYGVSKTFDLYVSPLEIDGEAGHVITLVDVTEAVEAESELRRKTALAAVGQATAQVAHEIRNPLGSIRLGVSMLREMTDAEDALSTINLVERGIDHLQKLVVDVTQFSRQRPLQLRGVDLHGLLEQSIELVANKINEKQTPIEKFYTDENLTGEFDEDQLRQVFVNLLANGIDASEMSSPIAITTKFIKREVDDIFASTQDGMTPTIEKPFAQVIITDSGCGMDEEVRKRLFEPFFSTKAKGTGLGLAIVKQIVENHEGTIGIKSEVDVGTSFIIELPLSGENQQAAKTL